MNDQRFVDKALDQLTDAMRQKGHSIPKTIGEVADFPYSQFEGFKGDFFNGKARIYRYRIQHDDTIFGILASRSEKGLLNFYWAFSIIFPIISVVLCFLISWWWLFGVLGLFAGISRAKRLYNRVIFYSALRSEREFCVLYFSGQICFSLAVDGFRKTYFHVPS